MLAESQNVIQKNNLLSTRQAAAYLGKSLHTFNQHISRHIPKAANYGRFNYYRIEDLDAWFAKHLVDSNVSKLMPETA